MSIMIEQLDYYCIVKMPQVVNGQLYPEIHETFDKLLKYNNKNVIIDFSETSNIDSSGIGAISYLYKRLYRQELTLELIGLHDQPLKKIRQLQINEIINVSRKI